MKKIPTIFKRNPEKMSDILPVQHEDCGWVFDGVGVATRKYDGTCCLIASGVFYKRREIKKGRSIPTDFKPADYDKVTGKTVGWVPVSDIADDRWHNAVFAEVLGDGTYELCGPKIQGNPEGYASHVLIKHSSAEIYIEVLRTFEGIRNFLETKNIEGLVFHNPDGRMAKIKKRDYGMKR